MKCYKGADKLYEKMYSKEMEFRGLCYYCGEVMSVYDHVPPKSTVEAELSMDSTLRPILIPSCNECNSLAGGASHKSVLERKEYIHSKLRKRYRKVLDLEWEEYEIEELILDAGETNLIRSLKAIPRMREEIKSRLSFPSYTLMSVDSGCELSSSYGNEFHYRGIFYGSLKEVSRDAKKLMGRVFNGVVVNRLAHEHPDIRDVDKLIDMSHSEVELDTYVEVISKDSGKPKVWIKKTLKDIVKKTRVRTWKGAVKKLKESGYLE